MATDAELDAAVRRVLADLMLEGDPYTSIPLIDPDTALPPAATVDAIREPVEDAAAAAQATADAAIPNTSAGMQAIADSSEVKATYQARGLGKGRKISFLGESIATYNISAPDAFPYHLCALAGGRLINYGVYGTGGITLAQIESTYLPSVLALDPLPDFCVIAGITNDIGTGVAAATSRTIVARIAETLATAGIEPVMWKAPPRSDSTAANEATREWNAWVGFYAADNGYKIIDGWSPVVDPATGLYLSGYNIDSVHPSIKGHQAIGQAAAESGDFSTLPAGVPFLTTDDHAGGPNLVDPSGRLIFTDGVDGGGRPQGWAEYSPYHTGAVVTDSSIPGNWWQISRLASEGAGGGGYQKDITTGFSEGDLIYMAARFDMVCDDDAAGIRPGLFFQFRASGVAIATIHLLGSGGTFASVASRMARVPAGTDTIRLEMNISSAAPTIDSSVKYGQLTILNLTDLGVVE